MQSTSGSLIDRMIGAARLDPALYEEVERDTTATWQAAVVVILATIFGGVGSSGEGSSGFIGGIFTNLLGWAIFAGFVYFVGTRLLAAPGTAATWGEVARPLGFAFTPAVLGVFGVIPLLGPLVALVAATWFLAAGVVAIRQALEVSTGRAAAIGITAFLLQVAAFAVVALILGVTVYGLGSLF